MNEVVGRSFRGVSSLFNHHRFFCRGFPVDCRRAIEFVLEQRGHADLEIGAVVQAVIGLSIALSRQFR